MKRKLLCWILVLSLLLCACQTTAKTDIDPSGQVSAGELDTTPIPTGEVPFTQTDSFPVPFDGELHVTAGEVCLTADEALYDYDTMWLLLEENYPYLDRMEAELGINWREIRDNYRKQLDKKGYVSQASFIDVINFCLYDLHNVGHMFVLFPSTWQRYGDSWLTIEDDLLQRMGNLIQNPRSKQFYRYWEKLINNTGSGLSATISVVDNEAISPGITFGVVDDIPYVKISTFSGWTDDTYAAMSQFLTGVQDKDHLIIDIQGNAGGDIRPWMSMIAALIDEPIANEMFFAAKSGPLNLALNPQFADSIGEVYTDDSWREDFPYIQPEYVEDMDLLFKVTQRIQPSDTEHTFDGKVWVLVDDVCYSSADQFAVFCQGTGFATLVGTETSGNGIGAQPYVMALPYSGLVIYYEPYLTFNPDGSCNGIRGTQPDLTPEESQSALDTCLAAIHAEETNK